MIRVAELFAGVGGIRLGLERASPAYNIIWSDQWMPGRREQYAYECYERHYNGSPSRDVNEDIASAKAGIPDHDMLAGELPGMGAWEDVRAVLRDGRPTFVLLGFPEGVLSSPKGKGCDFAYILTGLHGLGYDAEWRVIDPVDYGFAQHRRRLHVFAVRRDDAVADAYGYASEDVLRRTGLFCRRFPAVGSRCGGVAACDLSTVPAERVGNGLCGTFYAAGYMHLGKVHSRAVSAVYRGQMGDLGSVLSPSPDSLPLDIPRWIAVKGERRTVKTGNGRRYVYTEGAMPFPDMPDRPARDMQCSEGKVCRSSHVVADPASGRLRTLTPVECERLNGFPDGWTEGMSQSRRYRAMSEASMVSVITMIGGSLMDMIGDAVRRLS